MFGLSVGFALFVWSKSRRQTPVED